VDEVQRLPKPKVFLVRLHGVQQILKSHGAHDESRRKNRWLLLKRVIS
ncbi:uncharacterized protein METZ01_LOCUS68421, partial [marine metagenome]